MAITRLVLPRPWTVLCRLIVTFLIMPASPQSRQQPPPDLALKGEATGGSSGLRQRRGGPRLLNPEQQPSVLSSWRLATHHKAIPPPLHMASGCSQYKRTIDLMLLASILMLHWVKQHSIHGIVVTKNHDNFQLHLPVH